MATPKLQLLSRTLYDTDGTTTVWDFNFSGGYLLPSHVKAYYENALGFRTQVVVTEAMLIGQYQLRITPALAAGSLLVIYRSTPKDGPMVDFVERGNINELALDTMSRQAVFVAAEAADEVNTIDWNKILQAATEAEASKVAAAASAASAAATVAGAVNEVVTAGQASANAAANSASQASTHKNAAASSAQQASTARDQAVTAWASSTAPAETLAAMSQVSHIGNVVKTLVVDTSRDSDGGAWREKASATAYFNQTLGGSRWIGQQASIAAAWAAAGSLVGAVFQASATAGPITVGRFYSADSATTATEVTRGISRKFPALGIAYLESSGRVVVDDASASGAPLWRVLSYPGKTLTSLAWANGKLFVGSTTGVFVEDFATGNLSGGVERYTTTSSPAIVNGAVNDIAATVLPDAPTDPATGLLVPTIAAFTSGGVSIIKQDGAVVNSDAGDFKGGTLGGATFLCAHKGPAGTGVWCLQAAPTANFTLPPVYSGSSVPTLPGVHSPNGLVLGEGSTICAARNVGLSIVKANPSTPTLGMVATISATQPGAWQEGDSRGAWLISAEAETVGPSVELATASYATTTGPFDNTTTSVSASAFTQTAGTTVSRTHLTIATVVNKAYRVSSRCVSLSTGQMQSFARDAANGGGAVIATGTNVTAGQTSTFQFVATTTASSIQWVSTLAGASSSVDSISIQQVEPDRSVKGKGLSIVGALTKTLVGGVAMYSGFGPGNYAEVSNTDRDYGTGDFHYMGWAVAPSGNGVLVYNGDPASLTTGALRVARNSGAWSVFIQGLVSLSPPGDMPTGLFFWCLYRRGGVWGFRVNTATLTTSTTAGGTTVNVANSVTRVGHDFVGGLGSTSPSQAYVRSSATAPSDDDLDKIYRDELPLFQPGAVGTLAGPSNAVTALAYDDVTNVTHALTSWGRSSFVGFARVDSEATAVGTPTSVSAQGGVISTAGSTGARIYMPALTLREELKRKDEARRALGKEPIFVDFDATASQTTFVATRGYSIKAVYSAGLLKRRGTGKDYTVTDDGYRKAAVFGTGLTLNTQVTLMLVRD
jgi:hypothetical protein